MECRTFWTIETGVQHDNSGPGVAIQQGNGVLVKNLIPGFSRMALGNYITDINKEQGDPTIPISWASKPNGAGGHDQEYLSQDWSTEVLNETEGTEVRHWNSDMSLFASARKEASETGIIQHLNLTNQRKRFETGLDLQENGNATATMSTTNFESATPRNGQQTVLPDTSDVDFHQFNPREVVTAVTIEADGNWSGSIQDTANDEIHGMVVFQGDKHGLIHYLMPDTGRPQVSFMDDLVQSGEGRHPHSANVADMWFSPNGFETVTVDSDGQQRPGQLGEGWGRTDKGLVRGEYAASGVFLSRQDAASQQTHIMPTESDDVAPNTVVQRNNNMIFGHSKTGTLVELTQPTVGEVSLVHSVRKGYAPAAEQRLTWSATAGELKLQTVDPDSGSLYQEVSRGPVLE